MDKESSGGETEQKGGIKARDGPMERKNGEGEERAHGS